MLLSIIVPLYNGRKYLSELLDSLLQLPISNMEVLIIDDGSTDDSVLLVTQYCQGDQRISYYRQDNQGIVGARNTGLSLARGEYLLFCDQDDKIDSKVVNDIIKMMQQEKAEMAFYSTQRFNDRGEVWECDTVYREGIYREKEVADIFIRKLVTRYARDEEHLSYVGHVWSCVFKKSLVSENKIIFKRFMAIEDDLLFVLDSLDHALCVMASTSIGYYWRSNPTSATRTNSYTKNLADKMKTYYQYRTDILVKHQVCSDKEMENYLIGMRQEYLLNLLFNESLLGFKHYFTSLNLIKQAISAPEMHMAILSPAKCPYAEKNKSKLELIKSNHTMLLLASVICVNYKRQLIVHIYSKFEKSRFRIKGEIK